MEQHFDPKPPRPNPSPSPSPLTDGKPFVPHRPPVQFQLGQLVITPGAMKVIPETEVRRALTRHSRGDWGAVEKADWKENDLSVNEGFRILSAYQSKAGKKFWIITEANRSSTCILLPEEY